MELVCSCPVHAIRFAFLFLFQPLTRKHSSSFILLNRVYIFLQPLLVYRMSRRVITQLDLDTGVVVFEEHRLGRRLHRDSKDGPAYIERSAEDGGILAERYYWNGKRHRVDGPAVVSYRLGTPDLPSLEMYYLHGIQHRDPKEGPAEIQRRGDVVVLEVYYLYGEEYRDPADGPSYIARYDNGETEWFRNADGPRPTRPTRKRPPAGPLPG